MIQSISLTSGKGGVGKTTLTCNLAISLAQLSRKVLIFDGDLGMSNVEIMFGVRPKYSIADVLVGKKHITEVVTQVMDNIWLVSGGIGVEQLSRLDAFQRRRLIDSLGELDLPLTDMIVDTAPGLGDMVLNLNAAVDKRYVIITPEPTSISDSYALIKVLSDRQKQTEFEIVVNQVKSKQEGEKLFCRFSDIVQSFLNVKVSLGSIVLHESLARHAISVQRPLILQYPDLGLSQSMRDLASDLVTNVETTHEMRPGLMPFWQSLVQVGA